MYIEVNLEELTTDRIRLRHMNHTTDRAWLLDFCKDDEAVQFFFPMDDREAYCNLWMDREVTRRNNNGATMYVIEDKASGVPVGQCGILVQEVDGKEWVEIGYSLRTEYRGKGYASEAAILCKNYIFKANISDLIISIIHPDNINSQRVAQRNGMTRGHRTTFRDIPVDIWSIKKSKTQAIKIASKLPNTSTNIFTVMSALAAKHGAINLSQGFPNYDPPAKLRALVTHYMNASANQYAQMAGVPVLRERLADKVESLYGHRPNADTEITVTAGGTQALFTAITAFVGVGDEVIIFDPAYDCYQPAIELCGGKAVTCKLTYPDYTVDWALMRHLVSARTRMIIFNTPHNPTGRVWQAADLRALAALVAGTDIIVLSDEVYEHLIYDNQPHQSVLLYPDLMMRSLAIYSFGKTFHATGWKMGYVVGAADLMTEFRKVHQFNVFSVNTPMQFALADYLTEQEAYLSLPDFYAQKRDYFANAMQGSRFKLLPCEGTYFQLADYSAISDLPDTAFATWLTEVHGVAGIPVSAFYSDRSDNKVIRFCFAKTPDLLDKAAEKLRLV